MHKDFCVARGQDHSLIWKYFDSCKYLLIKSHLASYNNFYGVSKCLGSERKWVNFWVQIQGSSFTFTRVSHISGVTNTASKASVAIVTTFHIKPPGVEATKVCFNSTCHMTNMSNICVLWFQKLKTFFNSWHVNITWYVSVNTSITTATMVFKIMTLVWPWLFLRQGLIRFLLL